MPDIANPLTARMHKGINTTMDEGQTMIAHALRGEGFDASEDGTGRGTPLVAVAVEPVAGTMKACKDSGGWSNSADHAAAGYMLPVAFSCKDYGADAGDTAPTLRAMGHDASHANAGEQLEVAFSHYQDSEFGCKEYDTAAIRAGRIPEHSMILQPASHAVRRLTPRECERLQGFPDGWTRIPYRNKPAAACPDGPRYKALGNSWAINCGQFVFDRMQAVEAMMQEAAA